MSALFKVDKTSLYICQPQGRNTFLNFNKVYTYKKNIDENSLKINCKVD